MWYEPIMKRIKENVATGLALVAFTGMVGFGIYMKAWESRQPRQEIRGVIVRAIEPYSYHSEVGFGSSSNDVSFEGIEKPVDFPYRHWDRTVREGDSVDVIVRQSFPLFGKNELHGLKIDDYK